MQKKAHTDLSSLDNSELISRANKRWDEEYRACAMDYWYFARFLQTDDEEREAWRTFPLNFDYLHRANKEYEDSQRVAFLKSRRMLISLLAITKTLHRAMFAGTQLPGTKDVYYTGYSATDEDVAKYQMGRISQIYHRLPEWMKRRNPLNIDNTLYLEWEKGGKIQGFPLKRQGPQGYGFSEFIFDEAAWQEAARTTWKGLSPTIGRGKIIVISTPNGMEGTGRFFYELWSGYQDRYKNFNRVKIHWKENPEHDQAWFDMVTDDLEPWEIQQMYEMSFVSMAGTPVWPKFDRQIHVLDKPPQIIENRPIYPGWDFGFHYPAITFWQRNHLDQWVGFKELIREDIEFGKFCDEGLEFAGTFYDRRKHDEVHFVDPAGFASYSSKAESGAMSSAHEIAEKWRRKNGERAIVRRGAVQTGTRSVEGPRLREVRALWIRKDRSPGILLSPEMEVFIDGCGGGYCYDRERKSEEPEKNYYSHTQDSFQYVVTGWNRMVHPAEYNDENNKPSKSYRRIGHRTGL